jgi:6-phosphofructokinase 1
MQTIGGISMALKSIAVLTSGGDAPGMNAAVRAVVRTGISYGMRVVGVLRGYNGLLNGDVMEMNLRSVSDIIHRGGTILYTARSPEFNTPEGVQKAADNCRKMGIDGVVVIGGDGSFRGARDLTNAGIPCIGIPGTIDNDIASSEYTIGFDTAMNTAVEMVDRLRDTMESHDRCSVVEVMGRRCGDLALQTGIAVGATSILVPEIPYDFQRDIIDRMTFTQKTGKKHFIIIVAEGVGGVDKLAKDIEQATGIETRATVLGHVQRGGSPTLRDRVVGSQMGAIAAKKLYEGYSNRVIVMRGGRIVDLDITEALNMKRVFDKELYDIALRISI